MLITREVDYALRILRALSDGKQATAGAIAKKEVLPQQFAYKIIKKLSRAGLVQIVRGSGGGCRLIADLNSVTLYDLFKRLGTEELLNSCMDPAFVCHWEVENQRPCTVHCHLMEIQDKIDQEMKSYTIQDLLK